MTSVQQRETHLRTLQLALLQERNLRSHHNRAAVLSTQEPSVDTGIKPELQQRSDDTDTLETDEDAIDLFQLAMQPL